MLEYWQYEDQEKIFIQLNIFFIHIFVCKAFSLKCKSRVEKRIR
jgi:hypothetical protein